MYKLEMTFLLCILPGISLNPAIAAVVATPVRIECVEHLEGSRSMDILDI